MCENPPPNKNSLAFKYALETRNFEIKLYWRRSAYFWTLIAAIFAGFGMTINGVGSNVIPIVLSNIAIVLCCAWVCVNKGSKYWQENWEYHVDQKEDDIVGSLFKTLKPEEEKSNWLTRPARMSVSKINQLISWYMLLVSISFLFYAWHKYPKTCENFDFGFCIVFTVTSFFTCFLIYLCGRGGKQS